MKAIPVLCFLFLSSISLAQKPFEVKASIDSLTDGDMVYLIYTTQYKRITDSSIVKNKKFSFNGNLNEPVVVAKIFLQTNPYIDKSNKTLDYVTFMLEPAIINLQSSGHLASTTVKGSKSNDDWEEFKVMRKENDEKFRLIGSGLSKEQLQDEKVKDSLIKQENELLKEFDLIRIQFSSKHPDSYFGLMQLFYAASRKELTEETENCFANLASWLKETDLGKKTKRSIMAVKYIDVGEKAPVFSQISNTGKKIALSDFNGKYVLLDFWASWCGPCREENPNLKKAYEKYKNKNFTILGVSLDTPDSRERWEESIKKDGLTWDQISDLKGWENEAAILYGVKAIPKNYLINPKGIIIAKDIRGVELQNKLSSLLGNSSN